MAILAAIGFLFVLIAGGLLFANLSSDGGPRAAIVDQLSLTQPNPDFAQSATTLLEQAGYEVDYYHGEQVTVDFYRDLPTFGYDLLVLRVHSSLVIENGELTDQVSLFTGEPYSATKYLQEQNAGVVGASRYLYEGSPHQFGVVTGFLKHSMTGSFDNTLIVMMGCDGLRSQRTARAFLDKGASAFVSWSASVSATHTDTATERLLELLLLEGLTPEEAVSRTAAEIGPDPSSDAELRIVTDG